MSDQGRLADFGAFYERAYPVAFRVAYGIVGDRDQADDVTQEAFATAYRERARYRGDGPPEAWLYRIVVNAALATLRRGRVLRLVPLDPLADGHPTDELAGVADRTAIAEALDRLDPRSRAATVLRYYLDLDYATIGTILGTSPANVGAILSRALDRLHDLLAPVTSVSTAPPVPTPLAKEAIRHG